MTDARNVYLERLKEVQGKALPLGAVDARVLSDEQLSEAVALTDAANKSLNAMQRKVRNEQARRHRDT